MKRGRKSPSETPTQEKRSGKQKNSIQVAVRCRPLNSQERQLGNKNVWRCTGKCVEELEDDGVTLSGKSHAYDNVFGPEITTAEVYERQCKSIVLGSLGGYNGTIFAYGQTSSGKTFTLVGDVGSNPGVTPRALADVFHSVHENRHIEWDVTVSYLEIYNEAVTDLLQTDSHKGTNMHVYEDKVFGPTVRDLTELRVLNLQHCLDILASGEKRRHYAATGMNATSSRSHTLFRVRLESRAVSASKTEEVQTCMRQIASELMATREKLGAQHASLYFVDRLTNELFISAGGDITLRLPMTQGIAGAAATSGNTINVADAYRDKRFNREVDKKTGIRTRTILCMPIAVEKGEVIGVAQFMNKKGDELFDSVDEESVAELKRRIAPVIVAAQSSGARVSTTSLLNLVDLAGSERAKKTSAAGAVLVEACNINSSLLMLGTCISLLSEGKEQHIPYRNSKLTMLLSTSLGGNTNTCMICAISPAARNRGESNSSLQFASRAKKIVNVVQRNVRRDQTALVEAYEIEIAKLKAELIAAQPAIQKNPVTGACIDFVASMGSDFSVRLKGVEEVCAEVEDRANAMLPLGMEKLRLRAFVVANASGDSELEVVVAVTRPTTTPSLCNGDSDDNPSKRSHCAEWISEDELDMLAKQFRGGASNRSDVSNGSFRKNFGHLTSTLWSIAGGSRRGSQLDTPTPEPELSNELMAHDFRVTQVEQVTDGQMGGIQCTGNSLQAVAPWAVSEVVSPPLPPPPPPPVPQARNSVVPLDLSFLPLAFDGTQSSERSQTRENSASWEASIASQPPKATATSTPREDYTAAGILNQESELTPIQVHHSPRGLKTQAIDASLGITWPIKTPEHIPAGWASSKEGRQDRHANHDADTGLAAPPQWSAIERRLAQQAEDIAELRAQLKSQQTAAECQKDGCNKDENVRRALLAKGDEIQDMKQSMSQMSYLMMESHRNAELAREELSSSHSPQPTTDERVLRAQAQARAEVKHHEMMAEYASKAVQLHTRITRLERRGDEEGIGPSPRLGHGRLVATDPALPVPVRLMHGASTFLGPARHPISMRRTLQHMPSSAHGSLAAPSTEAGSPPIAFRAVASPKEVTHASPPMSPERRSPVGRTIFTSPSQSPRAVVAGHHAYSQAMTPKLETASAAPPMHMLTPRMKTRTIPLLPTSRVMHVQQGSWNHSGFSKESACLSQGDFRSGSTAALSQHRSYPIG
eukprot:TRINITY_DN18828_c0_g1_i2.p1 TRINITY_DN18828_c0_g1~~TRINITY_DN18828_c0_g1_i2.p1  ORF type:complete len:1217 (-),score=182.81 TRINITY_DN18828_c0_g1_i2:180-3830(-)